MAEQQNGAPVLGAFLTALSDLTAELRKADQGSDVVNIALAALRGKREFKPLWLAPGDADGYVAALRAAGLTVTRFEDVSSDDAELPDDKYADVLVTW